MWLTGWVRMERPVAEFWTLTPAQTVFALEAGGQLQRKGSARELIRTLGGLGVPIEQG